jgi:putative SOS response-associated peptidase YedK
MCGRYLRRSDKQRIAESFHISHNLDHITLPPWDYNVAPTTFQPIIRHTRETAERELVLMRWGLIPHFAKSLADFKGVSTINARAETLLTTAMWRVPFNRRRCLIPADGFYEWKKLESTSLEPGPKPGPKSSSKPARKPYTFTLRDQAPFAFAGLWDAWRDPKNPDVWLPSFTIITTTTNPLTASVHNRMPVILHPADYDRWLARPTSGSDSPPPPIDLLRPFPAEEMAMQEANPDVGNARNNHPGLITSQPLPGESQDETEGQLNMTKSLWGE